jgi:hypothetical protein
MSKTVSVKARPSTSAKLTGKRLPFKGSVSSRRVDSVIRELKRKQVSVKAAPESREDKSELREWIESIIKANEDTMVFTPEEVKTRVRKFLEHQRKKSKQSEVI